MKRNGPIYLSYLEALVLSLLAEREQKGHTAFDSIHGIDFQGNPVTYSPYTAKELLQEQNPTLFKAAFPTPAEKTKEPKPMKKRFSVNEYHSHYVVRHNRTGQEHVLGDGVDALRDENGEVIPPGTEEFRQQWEDELNDHYEDTFDAYFHELDSDDDELYLVELKEIDAIAIVIDLAEQNVIGNYVIGNLYEESLRQRKAIQMVTEILRIQRMTPAEPLKVKPTGRITYRQLGDLIAQMNDEQKDSDVTVNSIEAQEGYAAELGICDENDAADLGLDPNHPVISYGRPL